MLVLKVIIKGNLKKEYSMSDYKVSLKDAITDYQLNSGKINFKDVGEGSFFSWKVTVLLHKDGKWKFEDANLFKRILWKLEKLITPLKNSDEHYAKVDLGKIQKALANIQDKSDQVGELENRVNELMKKKGPILKEREIHAEEFPPVDQKPKPQEKPIGQGAHSFFPKDFEWLSVIPGAKNIKKIDSQCITFENQNNTPIKIEIQRHGELDKVQDFYKLPNNNQLCCVSQIFEHGYSSPDVLYRTDTGVRRYPVNGLPDPADFLLYVEYPTLEEALKAFQPNEQQFLYFKRLIEFRSIINAQDPGETEKADVMKQTINRNFSEFENMPGIEGQEFIKNILNNKNFNREVDLKLIDKAIEDMKAKTKVQIDIKQ